MANSDFPAITPQSYVSPLPAETRFTFVSAYTIYPYRPATQSGEGVAILSSDTYIQEVFENGNSIFSNTYQIIAAPGEVQIKGQNIGFTTTLKNGATYKVTYTLKARGGSGTPYFDNTATYTFVVVENTLPLKPWTVTSVINRLCDICEPIRQGERPRFRLNGVRSDGTTITEENKKEGEEVGQAAKFDKIRSPEFSFTRFTLRECLKEIGGFIHGEPRLIPKKDEDGTWYYEIKYDMFANPDKNGIYYIPYREKTVSYLIDGYLSWVDTNAENLVNQLDKYSGVIVEPYKSGAKTVRTENQYVRIEEGNMIISTQFPIYSIEKLEYVFADGSTLKSADITAYIFEKSVYDSQLSSYEEVYPKSKAYGLYYSQGNRNIGGLNFKIDDAVLPAFKEYAITNILKSVIKEITGNDYTLPDYPLLCFRVTYTPYYNARVAQTKTDYQEYSTPAALIYNQSANVIESRYYGENLKGVVARMGNVEKSHTYILYDLWAIPKAGQKYDDNYYIVAVAIAMYPTCFVCTIGLSKNFNRISGYIGVNSTKRFSEISQTQAVERNTLYREYIVVGNQIEADSDCLIGSNMMKSIAATFTQTGYAESPGITDPLTNVAAWGTSYKGNDVASIVFLPVISSAFGNSIAFAWKYEDNYSAGAFAQSVSEAITSGSSKITGYFQNDVPYTDYYGRVFYYNFNLQVTGRNPSPGTLTTIGLQLPRGLSTGKTDSGFISTIGKTPYILRKDNREALQVNFQIDFVTNINTLIIGSALPSYCPAVRGTDRTLKAKLYVFQSELNKFTDHVESYIDEKLANTPSSEITVTVSENGDYFTVSALSFPANGKSWAIVTAQTTSTTGEQVEDEFGETDTVYKVTGGDLLIGQNIEVKKGQAFTPVYFTKKREIFNRTVWKARR